MLPCTCNGLVNKIGFDCGEFGAVFLLNGFIIGLAETGKHGFAREGMQG